MTTIGYPYTLPTTGNVSFQEFFVLNAQYQRPVSDATAFRGRLRTALKEHKHSDRHDFLNVQKALEDYIPFLFGLVAGIENTELELSNEVETTWRCTISNIALSSKQPQVKHKSIHYEAIFTLLTLGYVLMDRANEYAQSVQNKILIAIGDISSYGKGHGEGSSSVGANHGANNTIHGSGSIPGSSSATSSSEFSIGISNSSNANSGNSSSGGSSGGGGGNSASRLFKKSSSNFSAKNSNTIGEFTDYLTDDDLAAIDHQLTTAADLYCKAAGVFEYIAQDMIPKWSNNSHITSTATAIVTTTQDVAGLNVNKSLSSKKFTPESIRPVDIQTSVVSAHIRLALAEAHSCTVRKAAIKAARASAIRQLISSGSSTVASGTTPKTSYVLLAKLTIGVKEEYERAYGLLKSVKDLNEISSDFRAHVKDAKVYYEALAQTLLGMDAYEAQHYGKAIGFLSLARTSFAALSKASKSHTIAQAAAFEYRLSNEKVIAFQKINDSVTFEQIPTQAQLLAVMPSGRDLLSSKKYMPPRPNFGIAATAGEGGQGGADESVKKLAYALQGAYF